MTNERFLRERKERVKKIKHCSGCGLDLKKCSFYVDYPREIIECSYCHHTREAAEAKAEMEALNEKA